MFKPDDSAKPPGFLCPLLGPAESQRVTEKKELEMNQLSASSWGGGCMLCMSWGQALFLGLEDIGVSTLDLESEPDSGCFLPVGPWARYPTSLNITCSPVNKEP